MKPNAISGGGRSERLREIMSDYRLTAADVSAMLGRSIGSVYIWRTKNTRRMIPAHSLALLERLAKERAGRPD